MNTADVRAIPVLREWLAAVATYREEIAESIASARVEIQRGEEWVRDQLGLWQRAVRDLEEEVHQAKMRLSAKKTPGPTGREPDTTLEEKDLRRARARLEHAIEKVHVCRMWAAKVSKMVDEVYAAPAHRLQAFLDGDLARGQAVVQKQAEALDRYADLKADFGTPPGGAK